MPVNLLFVEGCGNDPVDAPILLALLAGRPPVEMGGSKGSLKPKARDARGPGRRVEACYLRDRDFDTDPPDDRTVPTIDAHVDGHAGPVLGWRWCRHEIESYLIDPRIMAAASGLAEERLVHEIFEAAAKLQVYGAARWAIGVVRRHIPVPGQLRTRPDHLQSDFALPVLSSSTEEWLAWATRHAQRFQSAVATALSAADIDAEFQTHLEQLVVPPVGLREGSLDDVLTWYPGKELMAALDVTVYQSFADNPTVLRRRLRDWIRNNPDAALTIFPEWQSLVTLLRA